MNLIEFKNVSFSYAIDDDDENQVTVDVLIDNRKRQLCCNFRP